MLKGPIRQTEVKYQDIAIIHVVDNFGVKIYVFGGQGICFCYNLTCTHT